MCLIWCYRVLKVPLDLGESKAEEGLHSAGVALTATLLSLFLSCPSPSLAGLTIWLCLKELYHSGREGALF